MIATHGSELGIGPWTGLFLAQQDQNLAVIPGTALLFGLMLVAAIAGGYIAHLVRVPRVVGYLLAGCALKIILHRLLEITPDSAAEHELKESARPLKAITDIGLGVILFSIGGVFEVRHFKAIGPRILKIALAESGLTFALVFLGAAIIGLASGSSVATPMVLAFAVLLGTAAIATAPAATLFVIREYDAKGPTADAILSLTGLNNIICIVMFHLCFSLLAASGVLGEVAFSTGSIWFDLLTTTFGSALVGIGLGFALSVFHTKLPYADTLLILAATLLLVGAGEGWLLEHYDISYNFLLTALFMGATFANIAINPSSLDARLQDMSRPILVGFFVIAGYKLHLADLASLQYAGIAYIGCRILGKVLGAYVGLRWAKSHDGLPQLLGSALLCQAAVVIGLADFVETYWQHDWADRFVTIVLGSVVMFEICGPLLTKSVVKRAGEVKVVTLLRRTGVSAAPGAPILALSWHSLLRTIGLGQASGRKAGDPLQVRHIMRGNVKCISASADFDQVLHQVEQSRFNHFPVINDKQDLVGIIHFKDIQGIFYDPHLVGLLTAADIADTTSRPVPADMPLTEVLAVFQKENLGSLPVVDAPGSKRVVGIIEQRDVLRAAHLSRSVATRDLP